VPSTLVVKKGTTVKLKLINKVPSDPNQHGFAIPAYNIAEVVTRGEDKTLEFKADKDGIFPINCQLHPAHVGGEYGEKVAVGRHQGVRREQHAVHADRGGLYAGILRHGARALPARPALDLPHHAQSIASEDPLDIGVGVTALQQRPRSAGGGNITLQVASHPVATARVDALAATLPCPLEERRDGYVYRDPLLTAACRRSYTRARFLARRWVRPSARPAPSATRSSGSRSRVRLNVRPQLSDEHGRPHRHPETAAAAAAGEAAFWRVLHGDDHRREPGGHARAAWQGG
jgi:hypothetical protein